MDSVLVENKTFQIFKTTKISLEDFEKVLLSKDDACFGAKVCGFDWVKRNEHKVAFSFVYFNTKEAEFVNHDGDLVEGEFAFVERIIGSYIPGNIFITKGSSSWVNNIPNLLEADNFTVFKKVYFDYEAMREFLSKAILINQANIKGDSNVETFDSLAMKNKEGATVDEMLDFVGKDLDNVMCDSFRGSFRKLNSGEIVDLNISLKGKIKLNLKKNKEPDFNIINNVLYILGEEYKE